MTIRAFLTKTAHAELLCPWQVRSALTSSLSEAFHHSLQLNIHHQKTGHRPFTPPVNEPASWIFLSSGLFYWKAQNTNRQIRHNFERRVYIPSELNGPYRGLNLGSIALNLFLLRLNPREAFSFLSCLVDPQRLDNISTLLTLLMKVWHWFLNRPSLCFTVEPDIAALIQHLKLQATVFHCLIQLNMADTLTLHLSKQKQHIMISPAIMADWFDLVQGAVDLFSFMPI